MSAMEVEGEGSGQVADSNVVSVTDMAIDEGDHGDEVDAGGSEYGDNLDVVAMVYTRIGADGLVGFLKHFPVRFLLSYFGILELLRYIVLINKFFYGAVSKLYDFGEVSQAVLFYRMECFDILSQVRFCSFAMLNVTEESKKPLQVVRRMPYITDNSVFDEENIVANRKFFNKCRTHRNEWYNGRRLWYDNLKELMNIPMIYKIFGNTGDYLVRRRREFNIENGYLALYSNDADGGEVVGGDVSVFDMHIAGWGRPWNSVHSFSSFPICDILIFIYAGDIDMVDLFLREVKLFVFGVFIILTYNYENCLILF